MFTISFWSESKYLQLGFIYLCSNIACLSPRDRNPNTEILQLPGLPRGLQSSTHSLGLSWDVQMPGCPGCWKIHEQISNTAFIAKLNAGEDSDKGTAKAGEV